MFFCIIKILMIFMKNSAKTLLCFRPRLPNSNSWAACGPKSLLVRPTFYLKTIKFLIRYHEIKKFLIKCPIILNYRSASKPIHWCADKSECNCFGLMKRYYTSLCSEKQRVEKSGDYFLS